MTDRSLRKRLEFWRLWICCLVLLIWPLGCGDGETGDQAMRSATETATPKEPAAQPVAERQSSMPGSPPPVAPGPLAVDSTALSSAPQWGDLRARFVFDGAPPARKRIQVTADIEFCGKQDLYEENLVVNPANAGVANVVVWMVTSAKNAMFPIRGAGDPLSTEVILDAEGCRFEPHVTLLRTDQTLIIRNENPIGDSAKIDTFNNPGINIILPEKGQVSCRFPVAERQPAAVSCTVHPWESGWLIVKDHPFMAVSDADGKLEIKDVPVGKWTFQFWQEKARYITEARIGGKVRTLPRGRMEMDITAGANDLGDIALAQELFRD